MCDEGGLHPPRCRMGVGGRKEDCKEESVEAMCGPLPLCVSSGASRKGSLCGGGSMFVA